MTFTSMTQDVHVVWLKRDLRVRDHEPLYEASQRGRCLIVYVYEPKILKSPEYEASHQVFINEALRELQQNLEALGGTLILRQGRLPDVFEELHREVPFADLWSHEETGNAITYARDLRVQEWCARREVRWHEPKQTGVIRRLKSRDGWATRWEKRMNRAEIPRLERIHLPSRVPGSCGILPPENVGLGFSKKPLAQRGGEALAWETLHSFQHERGQNYRREMSSPLTGELSCSRVSTYLAWGCISMKMVHQSVERRIVELRAERRRGGWIGSMQSFSARLRWHCHFMQKLEDEPELEFRNLCRTYDGMRENSFNEDYFQAWCEARTGYPMIDACMRAVQESGWINFRMRAMLVSFASYHLWLDWKKTAPFLGRHFLDFEPGIHFSQFQMQSGTTGINTLRIYSPAKQALDQDPEGLFVTRYLPALAKVPLVYLAEPHRMPKAVQHESGCVIGRDYPAPIVDHATAYKSARDKITVVRKQFGTWVEAKRVYEKHGSRKSPPPRRPVAPKKAPTSDEQLTLF